MEEYDVQYEALITLEILWGFFLVLFLGFDGNKKNRLSPDFL